MSGFIAIYNTNDKPVQARLLTSIVESLKFRGPDKQKIWIDGSIGLGHALFQTTNEAKYERQPATLDSQVWITCSARIDDRKNLVNKLNMKKEINLDKTPDSELILHAYRKWGEDCLEHLLGDFAFAIWDNQNKKIFCARDRFGMKQLYYTQANNEFLICNTLDTIRQYSKVNKNLNDKAIAGFLLFGDHTWLDKSLTVLENVYSLLPAHTLVFQNNEMTINRYWDIPKNLPLIKYKKKSDYIEHFLEIFKTAVEDRIRTPSIAISLSGGMDSTSIAATIRELEKENKIKPLKLQAITSVYDRLFSSKERYYSGLVAKHLSIPIHYLPADDYPFFKLSDLTPVRPLELYNHTYWLNFEKTVASYSRVILSGDAGDEILKYSPAIHSVKEENSFKLIYDIFKLSKQYGKRPALGLRSLLKEKDNSDALATPYSFPNWLNPKFSEDVQIKSLWENMWRKKEQQPHLRHPNAYNALLSPDWNTDDMYMQTDFTLSEKRNPFLDVRLVEFLFSIPSTPWFFHKHILRESMKDFLPQEIVNRPKTVLGNMHIEILNEPKLKSIDNWEEAPELSNYILKDKIPRFLNSEIDESTSYLNLRILLLNNWLKKFSK